VSFEDLKASIRNSIITGQVVRDEVGRTVKMSNAVIEQRYYDDHKAEFDPSPSRFGCAEILVPTAANADETYRLPPHRSPRRRSTTS
jgi:peptidyl-prolyl cis-trans isomerase SurA